MDARALGAAAGIDVVTINAWISRGYVPGVAADAQGRRRDFDIKTATHLGIMAELIQYGFGAPLASITATHALNGQKRCCMIAYPYQANIPLPSTSQVTARISSVPFDSENDLSEAIAGFAGEIWRNLITDPTFYNRPDTQAQIATGILKSPPNVYMIINIQRIALKMEYAEFRWQEARRNRSAPSPAASPEKSPAPAPSKPPARRQRRKKQ